MCYLPFRLWNVIRAACTSRKRSSPGHGAAALPVGDEPDHVGDPIPVGAQREKRSAAAPQRSSHLCAVRSRGLLEVGAQLLVDGELAGDAGFGVLQDDVADGWQFHVARVEDLDAQHLVTT